MGLRQSARTLRDAWIDRLWVDVFATTVLLVAHYALVATTGRFDVLAWATPPDRRGAYAAAAVVISLVGSLSGITLGQLGSASGPRAVALKRYGGPQLARNWRSIFQSAMLAALLAVAALLLDPSSPVPGSEVRSTVARWAFEFGVVLVTVKFARLTSLFHAVLSATAADSGESAEEPTVEAAKYDPGWLRTA